MEGRRLRLRISHERGALKNKHENMDEAEWFLNTVLVPTFDGASAFLYALEAGPHDAVIKQIEAARKRPCFASMSHDVIRHILSFTTLSDTRTIMRVCKKWYEQTRLPLFWAKHILCAKQKAIAAFVPNHSITREADIAAIYAFDTFASPVPETLRDQVEWVFRMRWLHLEHSAEDRDAVVVRKTARKTCYEEWRNPLDNKLHECTWFESSSFSYEGKMVTVSPNDVKFRRIEVDHAQSLIATRIIFRMPDDSIFDGQGLNISETGDTKYRPHGNGKWIFADGTVLEGECVAYKGEPRFIEPPSKRNKVE